MNDYQAPEQIEDQLARHKRASLRNQVQGGVWHLDALVQRVEREAPEVHRRLRSAVEALQLLGAHLTLKDEGDVLSRPTASVVAPKEINALKKPSNFRLLPHVSRQGSR